MTVEKTIDIFMRKRDKCKIIEDNKFEIVFIYRRYRYRIDKKDLKGYEHG